jgi:multidrug efflux system membrane fusion protein
LTTGLPPAQVTQQRAKKGPPIRLILLVVLVCVAVGAYFFFKQEKKEARPKRSAVVTLATAAMKDVPDQVLSIGNVVPLNSVAVKPRIGGRVVSVNFTEGQIVKKKDLLFVIDPRPSKAALMQAESEVAKQEAMIAQAKAAIAKDQATTRQVTATLKRDVAIAKQAERDAARFDFLAREGAVSEADMETRDTRKESTSATVEAGQAGIVNAEAQVTVDKANLKNAYAMLESAKANLQNAKIQVGFSTVNAPIEGRTGHILVLQGNVVRADEDILTTIVQTSPIYVELSVPQEGFRKVQECATKGALTVRVTSPNGKILADDGKVTFMDNTVDNTTGTVKLKAIFDNKNKALWPGQYVDVVMNLSSIRNAVVVPTQAVQTGQKGQFVWIVDANKTAHMIPVTVGPAIDGVTAILKGIKAGDQVVSDGHIQLSEGVKVTVAEPVP